MRPTQSRLSALHVMRAIRSGELADRAFARVAGQVPPRERAWLHELVYGALRLRGRLDFLLDRHVVRGTASLDADVLDVLRLGAYQLLEMRSVPAYAAVSQSVEVTKAIRKHSAAGLVNAVLQSLRRMQTDASPAAQSTLERLSTWGSHPEWLVARWIQRFGEATAEAIVERNNQRPDLYIRPIGIAVERAIVSAAAAGVTLEAVASAPDALRVATGSVEQVLGAVRAIVQDPAAGLIVRYAAPTGGLVADVCAAPGGKAIVLASEIGGRGRVIASDLSARRLARAVENARRIGELDLNFAVADARAPVVRQAELVLLDAPCTGTGTFRRHPDGKWRITSGDLRSLLQLQSELLDAASGIVKIGGMLVYSTCSIEAEENQEQVTAFLDRHPEFLRRPPAEWHDPSLLDDVGNLVVLPHASGFDGSFAARLERVA